MALSSLLKKHRACLVIMALASVIFFTDISVYKEFVRAESYFGLGARSMIEDRDWLTPHAPDELPLNKPPLTYWLIGLSYKIFGASHGSARVPSALAALLVLAIVYAIGLRISGQRPALVSMAMLSTSYLFFSFARMAMSDMLLTLFVTASLASFFFALTDEIRSPALVLCGYAALALGVLTKGPVAIVLIAVPVGVELFFRRNRGALKQIKFFPGVLLFLLISVPYFLMIYVRLGSGPLQFFFLGENLQRFTGQVYGAYSRPIWNEVLAFFSDFAPWSLLIFSAVWFNWRRRGQSELVGMRFLCLWLGSTLVLFSLSSFKLDYYLLPAMPAAALITAPLIANAEELPRFMCRIVGALLTLLALGVVVMAVFSLKAATVLNVTTSLRFLPLAFALAGTAALLVCVARGKISWAALVLAVTIGTALLTIQLILLPAFPRYLPALRLAASVPAGSAVYVSSQTTDWANDIAFDLPGSQRVERSSGDADNSGLAAALKRESKSVAVMRESEYVNLSAQDPQLRIVTEAETFGHGGPSLKMALNPKVERLLLVGH